MCCLGSKTTKGFIFTFVSQNPKLATHVVCAFVCSAHFLDSSHNYSFPKLQVARAISLWHAALVLLSFRLRATENQNCIGWWSNANSYTKAISCL